MAFPKKKSIYQIRLYRFVILFCPKTNFSHMSTSSLSPKVLMKYDAARGTPHHHQQLRAPSGSFWNQKNPLSIRMQLLIVQEADFGEGRADRGTAQSCAPSGCYWNSKKPLSVVSVSFCRERTGVGEELEGAGRRGQGLSSPRMSHITLVRAIMQFFANVRVSILDSLRSFFTWGMTSRSD